MSVIRKVAPLFAIVVLAGVLTVPAVAKGHTINFAETTYVNGKELSEGSYKVEWVEKSGSSLELKFYRGKKLMASAPAKWVERKDSFDHDAILTMPNGHGSQKLVAIIVDGMRDSIRLDG